YLSRGQVDHISLLWRDQRTDSYDALSGQVCCLFHPLDPLGGPAIGRGWWFAQFNIRAFPGLEHDLAWYALLQTDDVDSSVQVQCRASRRRDFDNGFGEREREGGQGSDLLCCFWKRGSSARDYTTVLHRPTIIIEFSSALKNQRKLSGDVERLAPPH